MTGFTIAPATRQTCSVIDCCEPQHCRSFCQRHYSRWRKHGSTDKQPAYNRTGDKNPKWRGGQTVEIATGRVLIYSPLHPYPNWKNYVYRYRLVVEAAIGRYLLPSELVHHENEDPTDDRLENLKITNHSEHGALHIASRTRAADGRLQ